MQGGIFMASSVFGPQRSQVLQPPRIAGVLGRTPAEYGLSSFRHGAFEVSTGRRWGRLEGGETCPVKEPERICGDFGDIEHLREFLEEGESLKLRRSDAQALRRSPLLACWCHCQ